VVRGQETPRGAGKSSPESATARIAPDKAVRKISLIPVPNRRDSLCSRFVSVLS
jgi:hypothetical protein